MNMSVTINYVHIHDKGMCVCVLYVINFGVQKEMWAPFPLYKLKVQQFEKYDIYKYI